MMRYAIALTAVLLTCSHYANAQDTSIIAAQRKIDWSTAGVPGGIPIRTTVCATLGTPGQASTFVQSVTASQINSAISGCATNQAVKLSAGTYNLSSGITISKDNVTLRGEGANATILKFTGGLSCNGLGAVVCVIDSNGGWSQLSPGTTANWTAGYAQGSTVVTLSTTSGLSAGKLLMLDQVDDSSDDGTIYNCQVVGSCSQQGTDIGRGSGSSKRSQAQLVRVVSVSGNNVTITPGIYMPNWRSDRSPGAWWNSSAPRVGVGIEDLSVDFTAIGTSETYGIQFQQAYGSWVKGVRSIKANNAHVNLYLSSHVTVRDSYFYNSQNACSQSYGFEPWMGGDHLFENNIFIHITSPYVMSGGQGIVVGYTYAADDYYNCGDSAWFQAAMYHHESGSNYDLWEGNNIPGWTADNIHGPGFFATGLRNRIDGKDPLNTNTKTEQTVPVDLYSFSRYFNIIGNVLGTSGYHVAYEVFTTTTGAQSGGANCDKTIYRLGWGGNCSNSDNPGDPTLRNTIMRWGNYDTVNNAVRFVSSEVPTSVTYGNPVPSSQTLPASFYLSARPAFFNTSFGSVPWPAIGPDITGGNITNVAGHAFKIPAQVCYEHMTDDPAFAAGTVRSFSAGACYPTGTPPAPPTNLRISGGL
jgi:hypothetical protein